MTDEQTAEFVPDHEFLPVAGHPDDDECTHRADDTDATYCGYSYERHLLDFMGAEEWGDDQPYLPEQYGER